jgi:putative polyhydroxyalkanoate system protein
MSQFRITRQHNLPETELRNRVEQLAEKLQNKHGGHYQWEGNRVHYAYKGGLDAVVGFDEQELQVEVKLGLMMSAFKGLIEREVSSYLDENLA